MNQLICYCFKHAKTDIIKDFLEHNGKSTILAKIAKTKKANTCGVNAYNDIDFSLLTYS